MKNEEFLKYYNPTDTFKYLNPNPDGANKKTLKWDRVIV